MRGTTTAPTRGTVFYTAAHTEMFALTFFTVLALKHSTGIVTNTLLARPDRIVLARYQNVVDIPYKKFTGHC